MEQNITFQSIKFTLSDSDPSTFLKSRLGAQGFNYICACDSRTLFLTKKDERLKKAYSSSAGVIPDGRPIFEIISSSIENCRHITGPDLFFEALSDKSISRHKHFIIGGPESLMERIIKKATADSVNIVGSLTPPFSIIEDYDWEAIISKIELSKADLIWVGLGAPKQEYFMLRLAEHLNHGLAVGVGLAFDQYAGNVKRAPDFLSELSLEWLFRYYQQPKRFMRFIRPALSILPKFLWVKTKACVKRISSPLF